MADFRAVLVLIGGFLVNMIFGALYTVGNMSPYIVSYLRVRNASDADYGDSVWIMALASAGSGLTVLLGGFLEQKIGTRASVLTGGCISIAGVLLTFFTIKTTLLLTTLTYGLVCGVGFGIATAPPLACAMRWFPDNKGVVSGIIVAGDGGGAFVFDYIQTAFVNPLNMKPGITVHNESYFQDPRVLDRVPYTFLFLAGVYAAIYVVGVVLIRNPPGFSFKEPLTDDKRGLNALMGRGEKANLLKYEVYDADEVKPHLPDKPLEPQQVIWQDSSGLELSPRKLLKRREFYQLWFVLLLNESVIIFISSLYKAYGLEFIDDDRFLAITGSFASVFNACGRLFWGKLADRFSFRISMTTLCGCMAFLLFTLQLTRMAGKAMYFVWVCAIFLTFSGNYSMLPTVIARAFGQKNVAKNYGLLHTSGIISSPLAAVLSSHLIAVLGWNGIFYLLAAMSVISLLLTRTFRMKRKDGLSDI